MKRILAFVLAYFCLSLGIMAHPVDLETAKTVAVKFMQTDRLDLCTLYPTDRGLPAFYVFNTQDGFVIVSADDCETPIIGYSHEGLFDPDNLPVQMEDYLQNFVERIQYGIENQVMADEITLKQWELVKVKGRLNDDRQATTVAPLITSRWHQGCLYNLFCPVQEGMECDHASVGCVAMAMGQIMHYWSFPNIGWSSHSYYHSYSQEVLSADFGHTDYLWALMPNVLDSTTDIAQVEALATLLFHCGVAVDMNYTAHGSVANSSSVPNALVSYFKYSRELHRETMGNDMAEWLNKLKDCLDKGRPVLYSGQGSDGHAFVCDGYDSNNLLHFNWGWGGHGDGFFALGHLNPYGYDFNSYNSAIFDIMPNNEQYQVSVSPNPPDGGGVEGNGWYTCYQPCVLTAIPAENYEFLYWKKGNNIVSYDTIYSFYTLENVDDMEAVFSLKPVRSVTAVAPNQAVVNLSWGSRDQSSWPVLKQLDIPQGRGITVKGNKLYISRVISSNHLWKYTIDGELMEDFAANGCYYPTELTQNENLIFCNGENSSSVNGIDPVNHNVLVTIRTGYTPICSYDSLSNGIWIASYDGPSDAYRLKLYGLEGSLIKNGPIMPSGIIPNGSGFLVDEDGFAHLLIKTQEGKVYDYNLTFDWLSDRCLTLLGESYGTDVGTWEGKNVLYVCDSSSLKIMEITIKNTSFPIVYYRVFRKDRQGHVTMIADEVVGTHYTDTTWAGLETGLYQYGVCAVYAEGTESLIWWSEPVPKGNYDIEEQQDPAFPEVRIVFENGQLVIIKEGVKYNITGQRYR